jgi:hypothetical protein
MFDFIKKIFNKEPREEQIVEVEVSVKPKRKYKPRAPKTEVNVEEAIVIAEAPVEQPKQRIMARQLVGTVTPVAEPIVEPVNAVVVESTNKAPVKQKPAVKKPVEVSVAEPVVEAKDEPVVVKSVPKKPENKPKAPQNKSPRGKKKK